MIEPISEDDPALADDPIYAAMDPAEKVSHRRMLARARQWRREREEYYATHPPELDFEERVERLLAEQLELLKRIETKLGRLVAKRVEGRGEEAP
jgi:hypothetical protein